MASVKNSTQSKNPLEVDTFTLTHLMKQNMSLQDKILNGTQNINSERFHFVPNNGIELLTAEHVIKAELQNCEVNFEQDLVEFVTRKAKRLFLVLTSIEMAETISSFYKYKFDDRCLPIKLGNITDDNGYHRTRYRIGKVDEVTNKLSMEADETPFKAFLKWKRKDLDAFQYAQWQFLAPVFDGNPFHHNLHEKRPLPFVTYDTAFKSGFFGQVNKARIHSAHQKVHVEGKTPIVIAVKKLQRDAAQRFRREAEPLEIISKIEHPHIIKPIATYQQGESFCFLFPWADGGNLTQFWAKEKEYSGSTKEGDELMLWSLGQLSGLAGGLEALYNMNGRHGDLKPENILRFPDGKARGILQIADMGLTKFHVEATRSRDNPTGTKTGTLRYEPPECDEVDPKQPKPRSRDYDVWSMGCMYLEFLMWLVDGWEAVEKFTRRGNFEHFWEGQKQQYRIRDQVQNYMDDLAARLNRGNPNADHALKSLLNLIQTRLLKIKLASSHELMEDSDPKIRDDTRANAIELHREMREIYDRAKTDESYIKASWVRAKPKTNPSVSLRVPDTPNQPKVPRLSAPIRKFSGLSIKDNVAVIISPEEYNQAQDGRLNDQWQTIPDQTLARQLYNKVEPIHDPHHHSPTRLCDRCKTMNIWEPGFKLEYTPSDLRYNSKICDLCGLFQQSIQGNSLDHRGLIVLNRVESRFISGPANSTVISIYSSSNENLPPSNPAQAGFPVLPSSGGDQQAKIFREWLDTCDSDHGCVRDEVINATVALPTRVIDVGDLTNPVLYLLDIANSLHNHVKHGRYTALSHSWGKLPNNDFSTRKDNFEKYQTGIDEDALPKTFQDAIKVTRSLNVRYLWIDSLCIIQDDANDWNAESVRMEHVFSAAYLTIAASSAPSSHAGFLHDREARPFVKLDTPASGSIYLCKTIDDFQSDVEKSVLSSRGWVLQERALSRRSLFFTSKQAYWECGDGVRCETLAKLRNTKAAFLGDSDFPKVSQDYFKGGKIFLFQHLYKTYSNLAFTKSKDRPVAITGLEKRLGQAFNTRAGFGVFERFLGRALLWKWGGGDQLARIEFPATRQVPSWSWMAYKGGINYLDVPLEEVDWTDDIENPFEYQTSVQNKRYWDSEHRATPLELTVKAREFILDEIKGANGIIFDELSKKDTQHLRCVVVGRKKGPELERSRIHYVLIIMPVISTENRTIYERVGVGSLQGECIKLDEVSMVLVR